MITRSAPSFVTSGEGSFGLQIGAQAVDAILLIMNKSGVESLLKVKCKLGIDASIAAGPVGRDVDVKVGPDTAFLVYARAKGFYGGLSPEGGIITQDNSANERFYGEEVNLFLTTQIISTPCTCAIKIPITTGRINIRIHRDITGEIWFGVLFIAI
jgi:lipid-binding SYLF domain-containing protein